MTPTVARTDTWIFAFIKLLRSTCKAPANKRKLNIPFIKVVLKSISFNQVLRVSDTPTDGKIISRNITPNPVTKAIITNPTVSGNFKYLWFKNPKILTHTKINAGNSNITTS